MYSLSRPRFCLILVGLSLISLSVLQGAEDVDAKEVAAKAQAAASKGLAWLKEHQQADGSLGTKGFGKSAVAASLAGRAFLMSGDKGPSEEYRPACEKSLGYVLEKVGADGILKEPEGSVAATMYNESYVATFLALSYRHNKDAKTLDKLKLMVSVILNAQNDDGAWRYQFKKGDGDSSVTACAVIALRAAKDAGLDVPQGALDKGSDYLLRLQNDDGGFRYTAAASGSAFPRSAASAAALSAAGSGRTPAADKARKYLEQFIPSEKLPPNSFFLYGHYYGAQVMCHGATPVEISRKWQSALVSELARAQSKEGSWDDAMFGSEYATATACVILQGQRRIEL
jgi:hypothetical protein